MGRARVLIFLKRTDEARGKPKYERTTPMADFARPVPTTLSLPTLDIRDAHRDEARI